MDNRSINELASIKQELTSIIRELENISYGVRNEFKGVGSEACASCIDSVIKNYYSVQKKLNNLDTNTVTTTFAKLHK